MTVATVVRHKCKLHWNANTAATDIELNCGPVVRTPFKVKLDLKAYKLRPLSSPVALV